MCRFFRHSTSITDVSQVLSNATPCSLEPSITISARDELIPSQFPGSHAREGHFSFPFSTCQAREGLSSSFVRCTPLPVHGFGNHIFLDSCIPTIIPAKPGDVSCSHIPATRSVNLDAVPTQPRFDSAFIHSGSLYDFPAQPPAAVLHQPAFTHSDNLSGFYVQPPFCPMHSSSLTHQQVMLIGTLYSLGQFPWLTFWTRHFFIRYSLQSNSERQ